VLPPVPIAIISNEPTPYRNHLHRRIVAEVPEVLLWSLFTHPLPSSPWPQGADEAIRPVLFGKGERSSDQSSILRQPGEWYKGGRIIDFCRQHNVRAVIVNGYNDLGRLRIIRWCARHSIPCYLFGDSNIRCDSASGVKGFLKRILVGSVLRSCSGALYCGRLGREYFLKYGAPSDRLFPFPYEPNYALGASVREAQVEAARGRFGLRKGARYLIFSGRLVRLKRVDLLLAAYQRIAASRPEWDLIIAGDGPLRSQLRAAISSQWSNRVIWTGFIDDPQVLASLYAVADVLVLPSDYEPWGVVVTEAAVRLAIVASSVVGAAADLVEDSVNGRIFPNGDLRALTDALLEVTNSDTIDAMKAASPKRLKTWRRESDPIRGLREALEAVDVVSQTSWLAAPPES
jgi:glycosyltransferase involved in cell wall biosynthesis